MAIKLYKLKISSLLFLSVATLILLQCKTQSITSEHIIPVKSKEVIAKGEKLFRTNCNACHLPNQQLIGPPLLDWLKNEIKSG
jgi:mono/diheme cytochrome c family protein